MDTRVTLQTIVQGALADTGRLSAQLASLQAQAATGKKFAQISDDPATALTVLDNNTLAQTYATHLNNISTATSQLNASVSTLQQVSDLFSQAHTIALQATNSTNDTTSFGAMAQQVDAMLSQLMNLANSKQQDGSFIFGGTANRTQPFVVNGTNAQGQPLAVQYQGATTASNMFVDRNQQVAIDYAGNQVFQSQQRQTTAFTGNTGAQPGAGTDTATGRGQLLIQHTATTYAPGSGAQPGTNSTNRDTILGPLGAHQLHITDTSGNGSAGTVSLDGGPAVAFSNSDTNLAVTSAAGDTVFLNTTAITANFDGNVDVTSTGALSIDGGANFTPLTFAADQSVTDSSGKLTLVDTSNVVRTGNEDVTYAGTADAFQSLIALRDDLRNTRNLSASDQIKALSGDLTDLDRVHTNVLTTVGAQSATLQSLQSLQGHLQDLQLNAQKTASALGDVDMSQLVVNLQAYQNQLQLSLATFSRIVDQNLLSFLH